MPLLPSIPSWFIGEADPNRRSTLRALNINVGTRTAYDLMCGSASIIVTAYALALGINKADMGYLASVTYLAVCLQAVGIYLQPHIKDAKRFAIGIGALEPLLIIAMVALMPLVVPGGRLLMCVIFIALAVGTMQLSRPIIDDWIAQSIPPRLRPSYLSRRAQVMATVQIVVVMCVGFLADFLGKSDTVAMGGLIIFGAGIGLISVLTLQGAKAPVLDPSRPSLKEFLGVFAHKPFARVLIVTLGFNLPFYFGAPYYQTFNLDVLKMSAAESGALTVLYGLSKFVALFMAHKSIKYVGGRNLLLISGPFYAVFFAIFLFCSPDRYWPLYVAWCVIGLCDGTYNVVMATELYKSIPNVGPRTTFFATYAILSSACYGIIAGLVPTFLHLLTEGVPFLMGKIGVQMEVSADSGLYMMYAMAALLMLPCGLSGLAISKKER
jgi:hypothetical protein